MMLYALYLDETLVQTGLTLDVATDLLAMMQQEYPGVRVFTRRMPASY